MISYIQIGETILKNYFDHNCKKAIDDTEYIPIVKVIILGIVESMHAVNEDKNNIEEVKNKLKEFNRNLYTDLWLRQAREDEDDVDEKKESESARCCFDYIYKNEEYPR